jgi:hypothetical protein
VVERGARCNCTGAREKVHWVLVPSPEGSSVRRPRYLSEVMTVGGCVSVPSCLWNSTTSLAPAYITTTLCPQHQRYPHDTQHSTPKGFLLYHTRYKLYKFYKYYKKKSYYPLYTSLLILLTITT